MGGLAGEFLVDVSGDCNRYYAFCEEIVPFWGSPPSQSSPVEGEEANRGSWEGYAKVFVEGEGRRGGKVALWAVLLQNR